MISDSCELFHFLESTGGTDRILQEENICSLSYFSCFIYTHTRSQGFVQSFNAFAVTHRSNYFTWSM